MRVAPRLEPRAGERILDLCAAPGGKATHIAELTADRAEILAVDTSHGRMERLKENCERLGVRGVRPLVLKGLEDARRPRELHPDLERPFDAVLLDAPCSNTGVLARRPEARWRVGEGAIRALAEKSRRLLRAAILLCRPGGRVVFSTCSLEPEENAEVVERTLVANPGLRCSLREDALPEPDGPDGGYVARFELG